MVEPLIAALRWQQITAMARMPLLPAPLTALAIAYAATETTVARSALSGSVGGGWPPLLFEKAAPTRKPYG
jgi:hypothetical protein